MIDQILVFPADAIRYCRRKSDQTFNPGQGVAKFDRYLLSHLMTLFGFFSLVLVMVYWVNRAVVLFDQLIANGQSAIVFLEFTALSLPNVIRLVLPMAAFAAAVSTANRLASESELVVVQATGFSPFRLARPAIIFGIIVAVLVSILTHYLVPLSLGHLRTRSAEISENVTARLLRQGTFLHPTKGVTFYIGQITPEGELRDVFMSDARSAEARTDYSARSALLIRDESATKLVMFDGVVQDLSNDDRRLSTTSFVDFSIDVSGFVSQSASTRRRANQLSTAELFWPTPELIEETKATRSALIKAGHERISQATLSVVAALIGFSTLLVGGFSRFGLWRQIAAAVVLLVIIKSVDNAMVDIVRRDEALWALSYLATALGLLIGAVLLWLSARPAIFSARRRVRST